MGVPKVRGLSPDLDKIQERTDKGILAAVPSWILDGRDLKGVVLDSSAVTKVPHKLSRVPEGWMVQRVVAASADFKLVELSSDRNHITLLNGGSVACTVDLWVW